MSDDGKLKKVGTWLGVVSPRIMPGFDVSTFGTKLPYCTQCGALVAHEAQQRHLAWHEREGSSSNR